MYHLFLLVHILGGFGMGCYLLFPIMLSSAKAFFESAQVGYVRVLRTANHYAALLLFAQLLTGAYLISQGNYKTWWLVAVSVFYFSMGPVTGSVSEWL